MELETVFVDETPLPASMQRKLPPVQCLVPGAFPGKEEHEFILCIASNDPVNDFEAVRTIYGMARLQCIMGAVLVNGYLMTERPLNDDNWISVCAPFRHGRPLTLQMERSESTKKIRSLLHPLTHYLDQASAFLSPFKYRAVVVVSKAPSITAKIVHTLQPHFLAPKPPSSSFCHTAFCALWKQPSLPPSYDPPTCKRIDAALDDIIAKRGKHRMTVVLAGGKNAGKSTFARRIANYLVGGDDTPVYYLDADIGQSEFSPGGVMTLTRLKGPMLGQPFSHQQSSFELAYLYGDISPKDGHERYMSVFNKLHDAWHEVGKKGAVLIINTMGWVQDTGMVILQGIIERSCPEYIFGLNGSNPAMGFSIPAYLLKSTKSRLVPVIWHDDSVNRHGMPPSAVTLRDLSMVCYLAQALKDSRPVLSAFVDLQPIKNSLDKATIVIPEDQSSIHDRALLAALNMQMIALCAWGTVDPEKMGRRRLLGKAVMPWLVIAHHNMPPLRVIGYGFIRGINLSTRSIYLISPVELTRMKEVNCFVLMQNLPVPASITFNQQRPHVPYQLDTDAAGARGGPRGGNSLALDLYSEFKNVTGHLRNRLPPRS